jgi:hypothetical protein
VSGEHPRAGEADTLLEDIPLTEPALPATASSGAAARPLWPFALGLVVLGALLGFVVLRGPSNGAAPEASAASAPETSLGVAPRPPSSATAPTPATSGSAALATAPSGEPSAATSPRVAPAPALRPESGPRLEPKKAKPRPAVSAHIPTDLENPF